MGKRNGQKGENRCKGDKRGGKWGEGKRMKGEKSGERKVRIEREGVLPKELDKREIKKKG